MGVFSLPEKFRNCRKKMARPILCDLTTESKEAIVTVSHPANSLFTASHQMQTLDTNMFSSRKIRFWCMDVKGPPL